MRSIFLSALLLLMIISAAGAQKVNQSATNIIGVSQTSNGGVGVIANLTVEMHVGSGRVFLDTSPLTEIDTQVSARLAKEVACDTLEFNCDSYDFLYIIRSDTPMIGGPSAGAAMTVATMSAISGIPMKKNVLVTGTINPDGTVGPVGGILEKSETAANINTDLFLIPSGQAEVYVEQTLPGGDGVETVPANIISYARENLGIEVNEVRTVEEAFKYITGFEIQRETVFNEDVASQIYLDIMKKLAEQLMSENENYISEAEALLNNSNLSESEYQELNEIIDFSLQSTNKSKELFGSGSYYSAASFAVTAAVNSNYAKHLANYYLDNEYLLNQPALLQREITDAEKSILGKRDIDDINDVEAIVISMDRLREAQRLSERALNEYENETAKDFLFSKSFAEIRLITAYSWANITQEFSSAELREFNPISIRPVVIGRIEVASNYLSYAKTVSANSFVQQAENKLDSAREAFAEDKLVFALFEAIESRAYANLAMELRGVDEVTIQEKIADDINEVNLGIRDSEEKGIIPLLPMSYVEYAKTFQEDEPVQSLIFLSYAKQFSGLSEDLVKYAIEGEPRFSSSGYSLVPYASEGIELSIQATILIIGIAIGFVISKLKVD